MAAKPKPDKDREARRKWCVKQAMKWPQVMNMAGGGIGGGMGGAPTTYSDADVVGRARKLEDFILGNTDWCV